MKYYLYTHIGSGNRGCEATARSLYQMLEINKKDFYVFSENRTEELTCGTEQYATVIYTPLVSKFLPVSSIIPRCLTKFGIDQLGSVKYRYKEPLHTIQSDGIGLSTGGDVFCYNQQLADKIGYLTDEFRKRGNKTCLIACSIDSKHLTQKTLNILKKFDYIFPRESLSEENLKNKGLKNVFLYPDPAFLLPVSSIRKYEILEEKKYIGINYSSYVNFGTDANTNYDTMVKFIRYLLKSTDMDILLIPHVFWEDENDLVLLKRLKQDFYSEKRVTLIDESYNSSQLKYIISKCRFFVGARTHSVIAAYSLGIPTLALGYSIKARGIAKDIFGTFEDYVYNAEDLNNYEKFSEVFQNIIAKEQEIKLILNEKNIKFRSELVQQVEFLRTLGENSYEKSSIN